LKFKLAITDNYYKTSYILKYNIVYITDGLMAKPIEAKPTKYT